MRLKNQRILKLIKFILNKNKKKNTIKTKIYFFILFAIYFTTKIKKIKKPHEFKLEIQGVLC
jgi:hypothetical protein